MLRSWKTVLRRLHEMAIEDAIRLPCAVCGETLDPSQEIAMTEDRIFDIGDNLEVVEVLIMHKTPCSNNAEEQQKWHS